MKIKVPLNEENLITFFAEFNCCGLQQYLDKEGLLNYDEVTCKICSEPSMIKGSNGLWYYVSDKVFG